MTSARTILLSEDEKAYLLGANFLPPHLLVLVSRDAAGVSVTNEQAEEFRTAFTKQLAQEGFDEQYSPTAEGRLLEMLIDKFFVS